MVSVSGASRQPANVSLQPAPAIKPRIRVKASSQPVVLANKPVVRIKAQALASTSPAAIAKAAALGTPLNLAASGAAVALGSYPKVPRGDHTDDYFGVKVADPYRQLEDDPTAAAAFDKAQMAITRPYLDALPGRSDFVDNFTKAYAQPQPAI